MKATTLRAYYETRDPYDKHYVRLLVSKPRMMLWEGVGRTHKREREPFVHVLDEDSNQKMWIAVKDLTFL